MFATPRTASAATDVKSGRPAAWTAGAGAAAGSGGTAGGVAVAGVACERARPLLATGRRPVMMTPAMKPARTSTSGMTMR